MAEHFYKQADHVFKYWPRLRIRIIIKQIFQKIFVKLST